MFQIFRSVFEREQYALVNPRRGYSVCILTLTSFIEIGIGGTWNNNCIEKEVPWSNQGTSFSYDLFIYGRGQRTQDKDSLPDKV